MVLPAALVLQNAVKEPKQIRWFAGTHDVPEPVRQRAEDWLITKLGSGQPAEKAEAPKPDAPKPDAPKPDAPKAGGPKFDAPKAGGQ